MREIIIAFLVVVILIILAAAFVLPLNTEKKTNDLGASQVTEKLFETLAFTGNTVDVSNWQTYRDEKFGFEVKYPNGWGVMLSDTSTGGGVGAPSQSGYLGQLVFSPIGAQNMESDIEMFTIYKLSLDEQLGRIAANDLALLEVKSKFNIGNTTGINYGTKTSSRGDVLEVNNYIFAGKGVTYIFRSGARNADKYIPELQQVLLSFRLTK